MPKIYQHRGKKSLRKVFQQIEGKISSVTLFSGSCIPGFLRRVIWPPCVRSFETRKLGRNTLLFKIKDEKLTNMSYCLCKGTNKIIILHSGLYYIKSPHQDF